MGVVLLILKIIGIILLSIIGLILLLTIFLFFWPFSYRIKAHKDAEEFNAAVRILWLLGLLTATVTYDGEAKLKVRVLGIPVYKLQIWPTEEKDDSQADATDESTEASETEQPAEADAVAETEQPADTDSTTGTEEASEKEDADNKGDSDEDIDREIEERLADTEEEDAFDKLPLGKKIKAFIDKIKELILKLREKCYNIKDSIKQQIDKIKKKYKEIKYYYKLLQHPSIKPALSRLWIVTKKMLKHIRPRRLKAVIEYGSGDPASTMKVYGYYCMIYPFYGKKIKFTPDMENKVLNLDASLSGRVQFFRLMWLGWTLFADRNIRRLIRLVRREVKKRDRK